MSSRRTTAGPAATPLQTPTLLMPPFSLGPATRQSTPPPLASPLPRTPRPQRFLSPPKTPLASLQPTFGPSNEENEVAAAALEAGLVIVRPDSACSSYSSCSDSSVDSNITYTTAGGSITSVEDDDDDGCTPTDKGKILIQEATPSEHLTVPGASKKKPRTRWTEEMDAHLWKTYVLYQQDPKVTPFCVLPGQVPPLGVCHKVAREAKRSWKEAKLNGTWTSSLITPAPRAKRATQPAAEASNRGDALRTSNPYSFPASEASTRRRLRELCRQNYGPSRKSYNFHQQRRRSGIPGQDLKSRSSTISPSPAQSSHPLYPPLRDPFASTRNMALSLTTSTATSMRPNGVLASLAAGRDIRADSTSGATTPTSAHFGGILERLQNANSDPSQGSERQGTLGFGLELASAFGGSLESSKASTPTVQTPVPAMSKSLDNSKPTATAARSLLPPLELKSSKSPYGTWPRRLKRPDLGDDDGESSTTPLPPQRRMRHSRGTLSDLFGGEPSDAPATAPLKTRTRVRGYTISAGTNPFATRRRSRPSAPLLTVTGPVSYEGGNEETHSPLAKRERDLDLTLDHLPRRLGSPFMERLAKGQED